MCYVILGVVVAAVFWVGWKVSQGLDIVQEMLETHR